MTWRFGFDGPDLLAAVTTRHGGVSDGPYASLNLGGHVGDEPDRVAANRERVCAALGLTRLVLAEQVHGCGVAVLTHVDDQPGAVDVLLTAVPGLALTILVADCAPVVLYDPAHHALATVHAGRRGAVLDAPGTAVAAMAATYGTDPAELLAGVGPCIGQAHYEIGGDALDEARHAFDGEFLDAHRRFDLPGAVRHRLIEAGVHPERIEMAGIDTFTHPDFFSDRAQRPCGRFALVACLSGG